MERRATPRTPQEIQDRLNEITFNANLMRELRAIDFVDHLIEEGVLGRGAYQSQYVHRIDGTGALDDYQASSRLDARWRVFERLRDKGRGAARPGSRRTTSRSGAAAPSTSRPPIADAAWPAPVPGIKPGG